MATSKDAKDKARKGDSKKERSKRDGKPKKGESTERSKRKSEGRKQAISKTEEERSVRHETARKRKSEEAPVEKKKKKPKKEKKDKPQDEDDEDRRRLQGGAADGVVKAASPGPKDVEVKKKEKTKEKKVAKEKTEKVASKKPELRRKGPCAAEALDDEPKGVGPGRRASKSKSPPNGIRLKPSPEKESKPAAKDEPRAAVPSPSSAESSDAVERRRKRRESAGLKAASGFGLAPVPPVPSEAAGPLMYGPAGPLVPLPATVQGLLEHQDFLAQEVMRMKMAVEAAGGVAPSTKDKEEPAETTIKMPTRLTDCLMEPENLAKLLAKTGLLSAALNQEKHLILRSASRKQLQKTLAQLRRIAWACQWGCSSSKVGALLAEKPAKALNSMVLRLAATSSRLSSHDAKLNAKMRKIRLGTQAGPGMLQLEGIPGLSRKHCTVTFEPEKGACYVQDVSTNGTYLNGKRLPRPPFKNPADARVRLFHGDELLFKLRTDDAEELGYVINLVELS
ncbi:unnamed protein product [Durusdinium trenchii]|uniref:FHA domain-containing protein n=2 Tax=Durusdinium trenchii TaxID=1381693 RepID=A0ABP0R922_9DINO